MLGLTIIRTIVFWGLYWVPPIHGDYHVAAHWYSFSERREDRILPGYDSHDEKARWDKNHIFCTRRREHDGDEQTLSNTHKEASRDKQRSLNKNMSAITNTISILQWVGFSSTKVFTALNITPI